VRVDFDVHALSLLHGELPCGDALHLSLVTRDLHGVGQWRSGVLQGSHDRVAEAVKDQTPVADANGVEVLRKPVAAVARRVQRHAFLGQVAVWKQMGRTEGAQPLDVLDESQFDQASRNGASPRVRRVPTRRMSAGSSPS
jgi:hypothetical protein